MNIPHGLLELQRDYGKLVLGPDPRGGLRIIAPIGWEMENMTIVSGWPGYPHRLYVNKAMVEPLTAALSAAMVACPNYRVRTMGCFNPRLKRVNGAISVHAWGLAVDINADTNPQTKPGQPVVRDIPDAFGEAFEAAGFTWGLRFNSPDPQHFQLAKSY